MGLVVAGIQRPRFCDVGPLGEALAPERVVFGNRMVLRKVDGHNARPQVRGPPKVHLTHRRLDLVGDHREAKPKTSVLHWRICARTAARISLPPISARSPDPCVAS